MFRVIWQHTVHETKLCLKSHEPHTPRPRAPNSWTHRNSPNPKPQSRKQLDFGQSGPRNGSTPETPPRQCKTPKPSFAKVGGLCTGPGAGVRRRDFLPHRQNAPTSLCFACAPVSRRTPWKLQKPQPVHFCGGWGPGTRRGAAGKTGSISPCFTLSILARRTPPQSIGAPKTGGREPQMRIGRSRERRGCATHPERKTLETPRHLFREGTPGTIHGERNSSARALGRFMASGPVGLGRNGYRRVPAPLPSTNPLSALPISFRAISPCI